MKSKSKPRSRLKPSSKRDPVPLEMENWPEIRNIFYKPERSKYVRRKEASEECVFCRAADLDVSFDSLCVYKSKTAMVVLNKYPYNTGHLLVLPQKHRGNLLDLSDDDFMDLQKLLRLAVEAIYTIYKPSAVNLGMNHGKASGAGIPEHLHYHIIPRWSGDTNFFPLIAQTKVLVETLDQTYQRVYDFFLKKSKKRRE